MAGGRSFDSERPGSLVASPKPARWAARSWSCLSPSWPRSWKSPGSSPSGASRCRSLLADGAAGVVRARLDAWAGAVGNAHRRMAGITRRDPCRHSRSDPLHSQSLNHAVHEQVQRPRSDARGNRRTRIAEALFDRRGVSVRLGRQRRFQDQPSAIIYFRVSAVKNIDDRAPAPSCRLPE